jgi:phosphoenolpyruvate carboxykinase (ATP)
LTKLLRLPNLPLLVFKTDSNYFKSLRYCKLDYHLIQPNMSELKSTPAFNPLHFGKKVHYQLLPEELVSQTLELGQGMLNNTGALCVDTGNFTGRSPKDKFTVRDEITAATVDWGEVNQSFTAENFDRLYDELIAYLGEREVWVRDAFACADPVYQLPVRVVNETPWANLFCAQMFLRPASSELKEHPDGWLILQAPGFEADPQIHGTRQANFTVVSFTRKTILIGGTAYTGEMKKGIFSVLNFLLPQNHGVLSMHCSANEGAAGDVALFFGLSGTGKTTLSADSSRSLIGDDEHGWATGSVFNFEGGCYAKAVDLNADKEPEIFAAVRPNALLENVVTDPITGIVDFTNTAKTENTRVAYPINFIDNAKEPSFGGEPANIFFLTCDAFGILPPISKLDKDQAMYHFISGYTAKVAGTEMGVSSPQTTFSACFGRVFLPLHPMKYADLLGEKLTQHPEINVWLVNTGWIGGAYGTGKRISLKYTRALIAAAIKGDLNNTKYTPHPIFKIGIPASCPGVPVEILDPVNLWDSSEAYNTKAYELAELFAGHFSAYANASSEGIKQAAPLLAGNVIKKIN